MSILPKTQDKLWYEKWTMHHDLQEIQHMKKKIEEMDSKYSQLGPKPIGMSKSAYANLMKNHEEKMKTIEEQQHQHDCMNGDVIDNDNVDDDNVHYSRMNDDDGHNLH